jgi:DNA-directed RNA polymerase subunit beta
MLYFKIDKKKKLVGTTLLKALGLNSSKIKNIFYDTVNCRINNETITTQINTKEIKHGMFYHDILDKKKKSV